MSRKALKNVDPIRPEIRVILEEFLAFPEYQPIFLGFARHMGYEGDDMLQVKKSMFVVKDGQLGFNVEGLHDLFLEFQLIKQLTNVEPYRTLFKENPGSISKLRELAKRILNKEEVTQKHLEEVFIITPKTEDVTEE